MTPPWLHTEGLKIVTAGGTPFMSRGANLVRWNYNPGGSPTPDHVVADFFTRPRSAGGWGANSITVWVDTNRVTDGSFWSFADTLVDIMERNNAYVIFSWHAPNGGDSHPSRITDAGIAAMRTVAGRYRGRSCALYAAQAEPGNGAPDNRVLSWAELKPWLERTIDAIRSTNPNALIGVPGTSWSQSVGDLMASPILRSNIFVKQHIYLGTDTYPTLDALLTARRTPTLITRFPTMLGEFGVRSFPAQLMTWADTNGIGWHAWNLSDRDDSGNQLVDPMAPNARTAWGNTVYTALGSGAPPPPPVPTPNGNITAVTQSATTLPPGGVLTVNVAMTNAGTGSGTFTLRLSLPSGGSVVSTPKIIVAGANSTFTVPISIPTSAPNGPLIVTAALLVGLIVHDSAPVTVQVAAAPPPPPVTPIGTLTGITLSADILPPGAALTVNAAMVNEGAASGSFSVRLSLSGAGTVTSPTRTVAAGTGAVLTAAIEIPADEPDGPLTITAELLERGALHDNAVFTIEVQTDAPPPSSSSFEAAAGLLSLFALSLGLGMVLTRRKDGQIFR